MRAWSRLGVDPNLLLVAAWSLISLGAGQKFGTYTPRAIVMTTVGMGALTVAIVLLRRARPRAPGRSRLVLATVVAVFAAQLTVAGQHSHGTPEAWAHGLLLAAAISVFLLAAAPEAPGWLDISSIVLATGAGIAGIVASPRPSIDDWHMMQGASHALLHFQNIYGRTWPGSVGHQFPYLPVAAILVAPFHAVFGDVRFGLLAALVLAAAAVRRLGDRRATAVVACLILLLPRGLYGIEQSWPEPLLLALLAGTVWAVRARRTGLAVVLFTAALATKQTALLALPVAAVWPSFGWRRALTALGAAGLVLAAWFVAAPRAFVEDTISYNLHLRPRADSLSLFTSAMRAGFKPSFTVVPVLMVVCVGLAMWKAPRTMAGFVLGTAWLLGMLNLFNKQSFFNEWSLVGGLLVVGMAAMGLPEADHSPQGALVSGGLWASVTARVVAFGQSSRRPA